MEKVIQLTQQPIQIIQNKFPLTCQQCGSVVEFWGVVRDQEAGKSITHLDYEAYQQMAEYQMDKIVNELKAQFSCYSIEVIHRLGRIPVGEPSLYIRILSKHREEGFGMLAAFCNRLKQDVPIWKKAS